MKLRVTYRPESGDPVNLQVTADATATAGDVARTLAKGPGADLETLDSELLTLSVTDRVGRRSVLASRQPVVGSGLVSGAHVEVCREPRRSAGRSEPVALLRVVAGPDAGVEVPLPSGESTLGRAASSDVRLSDPLISKQHARVEIRDRVEVIDTNSANGVIVGGVRVTRVTVGTGDMVQVGDTFITIEHLRPVVGLAASSTDIDFVRSPRVLSRPSERKVKLPQPPQDPEGMRFPWLAMVAPLVMGAVLFTVTRSPLSIVFIALSPLLMLGNWLDQRREQKRRRRRAADAYLEQLARADARLLALHKLEREQLEALHPTVSDCVEAADGLGDLLWSRRPEHPEFLQVRLGTGPVKPTVVVDNTEAPGELIYTDPRDALLSRYERLMDAPVVADLRSVGGIGVSGAAGVVAGVARALVAQVVTLHSPSEVILACLTSSKGRHRWSWVEWLPHAASPDSPLGTLHLSSDAGTGRLLLDRLEGVVAVRAGDGVRATPRGPGPQRSDSGDPKIPSVLVIVDEPLADVGRLTQLAERGPDVGVHVLWVASARQLLPAACRSYLDLGVGSDPAVGMVREGELITPVRCESMDAAAVAGFARRLAPVVDVGMPALDESDMPRLVSVASLLGRDTVDDAGQVLVRWRENGSLVDRHRESQQRERAGDLRAVVGHTGIEPFALDLRSQGPHALVGGTTGSGKSEFLQAWVLGLAHAYSPDRVTFLFVDYKGGAAFARCTDLPHSVGMVTDLSPHLVRRALRSLRAEIRHRETLLREKGVKDLIDFELSGDPNCPPSLIIVVDEFAALKSEVPEFYEGVVDVAQRGRSLGLHLIMATQRPAGVITESLRANTNLRVALRMNDDHDSIDVLGDAMAARFDPALPGRGAARTGPGRVTQFQAAFPGARTSSAPKAPPIEVMELDFGLGRPWKLVAPTTSGARPDKDIDRVVGAVSEASRLGEIPAPRRPWLEPLAAVYNLELLGQRSDTEMVLGVMDDPDHQRQVVAHFRPDKEGNILYAGAGGSGKTTALRSLAVASGITPRGGPVQVYGLDFAGGGLTPLATLPHVGSIIDGTDEERVERLLRYLNRQIDERAVRYSAAGASSLSEYRALRHEPEEARILLLLDGFSGFRAEYDTSVARLVLYDAFRRVLTDGRGVGVHVAMTVDRTPAVPSTLAAAFQTKVILRQTNEDGYLESAVPKDVLNPASPPGRAMLQGSPEELQLAILGTDPSARAQGELMEQMAAELGRFVAVRPTEIQALPVLVPARELPAVCVGLPVLGIESESLAPVGYDPRGLALVTGPRQSGRTAALRWFADSLRRWSPGIKLVFLAPRRSVLATWPGWAMTRVGASDVEAFLREQLLDQLRVVADPDAIPGQAVFVENLPGFASGSAESTLVDAISAARRNGHTMFLEAEIADAATYGSLMTEAKQARTGIILQPETADEGLLRTPLPRSHRRDFPPGRGFWVKGGRTTRVQLPWVD